MNADENLQSSASGLMRGENMSLAHKGERRTNEHMSALRCKFNWSMQRYP